MQAVLIEGEVHIVTDGLVDVETDEVFSGSGETLLVYYRGNPEPLVLIVDDAVGLAEKIRAAIT